MALIKERLEAAERVIDLGKGVPVPGRVVVVAVEQGQGEAGQEWAVWQAAGVAPQPTP